MEYLKRIERRIIADLKGVDKELPKLESTIKGLREEREHMMVALRSVQKGLKDWDIPIETYPEPIALPELPGEEGKHADK